MDSGLIDNRYYRLDTNFGQPIRSYLRPTTTDDILRQYYRDVGIIGFDESEEE